MRIKREGRKKCLKRGKKKRKIVMICQIQKVVNLRINQRDLVEKVFKIKN